MRDEIDHSYRPVRGRRKLLVLLLGISTALSLIYMMLNRSGAPPLKRVDTSRCAPGQTSGCVGGTAQVITVAPTAPAVPAASAASAASR